MEHEVIPLGERHAHHNWEYADATERLAAVGFISTDINKVALQLDTGTYWRLTAYAPPAWWPVVSVTKGDVGLGNVDNTSDTDKPVSTAQALADTAVYNAATAASTPVAHATDTNNPHSVTKTQVGLGNVDNTSDTDKPVSTAQALADTAVYNAATAASTPVAHATDTNNPHSVTKTQVGLGNVDNTSDANKPVSTAQATALSGKTDMCGFPVDSSGNYLCTLTYNETTRTVTLTPTGASFDVFVLGVKYTFSGVQSIVHSATGAEQFVYFNSSGVLTTSSTAWDLLSTAPVCSVFQDVTHSRRIPLDERHHAGRDLYWHRNQHAAEGTKVTSGFAASGYTLNSGASDVALQLAIASGRVEDEDIRVDTQTLGAAGPYNLLYRSGASGDWQITRASTLPFFYSGNNLQYNQNTGATWQLTNVTEDSFVNYWVFALTALPTTDITPTPSSTQQLVIIAGQAIYASQALADAETVSSLAYGSAPFQEMGPLYKLTFRFNAVAPSGYTNTARTALTTINRVVGSFASISAAAQTDHGSLTGLTDQDHPASAIIFTPTGNIAATDVQAAIAELDTEKQAALVSGTNIKTVGGTSLLGSGDVAVSSGGISNVVTATTATTLTSTATLLKITPASYGVAVTLPDATTCSLGGPLHIIDNRGAYPVRVLSSAGTLLGFVFGGVVSHVSLVDNSTADGVWTIENNELVGASAQLLSPDMRSVDACIALDDEREFLLGYGQSNYEYGVVYNKTTNAFGAVTLIRAAATNAVHAAVKSADNQVLVVSCVAGSTAFSAVVLSISDTTIIVNTAETATLSSECSGFVAGCGLIAVGSSFVCSYTVGTPAAQIRALSISGTTVTIGSASVLDGTAGGLIAASGDKVIAVSTSGTHLHTRPYLVSGATLMAGNGTDTSSATMEVNKLAPLGNRWYVGYRDGTTVKGGIVSLADAGNGTTTISAATLFSSASLADAIIVGSNKVLAISAQSSLNANILTDSAGVASAGTAITLSSQTTRACLYASGTDVYVQDGTSDYLIHKIDCSGASPVHAEVLIGGRSSSEIAQFTVSNYILSRSPKAVYGADYARNVWRSAKTQNFDPEVRLGKFSQRQHIDYIADDSTISTAFRGSSPSSMWAASASVSKSYITKVECVA